VETDVSDYALAAILSIVNEDIEVHLVAFHSYTFTMVELNYNTHAKDLKGPAYPIDVVTDHKNLEYFLLLRY